MGKKTRRDKTTKETKTFKSIVSKNQEILNIKSQINQLGLGEGNPDVVFFFEILEKYSQNPETFEGKIPLKGHQRIIHYILPKYSIHTSSVKLLFDKYV